MSQAQNIIALDKKHVWHHLTQHKVFEKSDPSSLWKEKAAA